MCKEKCFLEDPNLTVSTGTLRCPGNMIRFSEKILKFIFTVNYQVIGKKMI